MSSKFEDVFCVSYINDFKNIHNVS